MKSSGSQMSRGMHGASVNIGINSLYGCTMVSKRGGMAGQIRSLRRTLAHSVETKLQMRWSHPGQTYACFSNQTGRTGGGEVSG